MRALYSLYEEYNELLDSQKFNLNDLDYSQLEYHLHIIESIDVVDSGCISIFDLYQRKHVYFSQKFKSVLNWDPVRARDDMRYTNSLIHPDDLPLLYQSGIYFLRLGLSIEEMNQKKDYKAVFDYRVIGKNGNYYRIIEQQVPLELDKSGNFWLALSMVDLSPDNDLNRKFRGFVKNHRTGELFFFPPETEMQKPSAMLTNREIEILGLIARGLISKEIAEKLYISVNTVNTHRQRIIEKLNVSNTYEAIRYANERGLFA
jgi:DNA-binding CsgD family transcriptional regulator